MSPQPLSGHYFKGNHVVKISIFLPKWGILAKWGIWVPDSPNFRNIYIFSSFIIFSLAIHFQRALNHYQNIILREVMYKCPPIQHFGKDFTYNVPSLPYSPTNKPILVISPLSGYRPSGLINESIF